MNSPFSSRMAFTSRFDVLRCRFTSFASYRLVPSTGRQSRNHMYPARIRTVNQYAFVARKRMGVPARAMAYSAVGLDIARICRASGVLATDGYGMVGLVQTLAARATSYQEGHFRERS